VVLDRDVAAGGWNAKAAGPLRTLAELRVERQLRLIGDSWWLILESCAFRKPHPLDSQ